MPDAIVAQLGRARATSTVTLGVQWSRRRRRRPSERALISNHNEFSRGRWRADAGAGTAIVSRVGFAPTFRYWPSRLTSGRFVGAAIGFNPLTPLHCCRGRRFSTAFNFGDHVAFGRRRPGARGRE